MLVAAHQGMVIATVGVEEEEEEAVMVVGVVVDDTEGEFNRHQQKRWKDVCILYIWVGRWLLVNK